MPERALCGKPRSEGKGLGKKARLGTAPMTTNADPSH
jgi:hypothetical protein